MEKLRRAVDFDRTIQDLLERLFLVFSRGNLELDRHFRITLFEPDGDALIVKYYANSENEPPRCMSLGLRCKKKEGCAGWAWEVMKPFILPDLDGYRKDVESGTADKTWFIDYHPEQVKIKSVVSIPVIIRKESEERLCCIISIDSDQPYYFRKTTGGEHDIRIKSYPFTRSIAFAYQMKELLDYFDGTKVNKATSQ